ncbi:PxxKW family cysteine-rich protein, partial [Thermodesulfobacteriota bacterium]
MAESGAQRNGFACSPIIDDCEGCAKVKEYDDGKFCSSYPNPSQKWKLGKCNFATHVKHEIKKEKIVNALKASKRKA